MSLQNVAITSFVGNQHPDFKLAKEIRETVFWGDQGIEEELGPNADDAIATHYLARLEQEPVGAARYLLLRRGRGSLTALVQRVAVLYERQGLGIGGHIMKIMIDDLRADDRVVGMELHAQESAVEFYKRLDFVAEGDPFEEVGITHQTMIMDVSA